MSRKRSLKGWAFVQPVSGGVGIRCRGFFARKHEAERVAASFRSGPPKVVRATLTLDAPKPTRRRERT